MKAQKNPEIYYSVTGESWTVIYQGEPLNAPTTDERAVIVMERLYRSLNRKPSFPIPVWSGDTGEFLL